MAGGEDDFVMDMYVADWVFNYIRSSARVNWQKDERLTYIVKAWGSNTDKYYRDGTWDSSSRSEKDWISGGFGPKMVMSPFMDFHNEKVREVRLAGTAYTVIGSWFTFEAIEDGPDEPVRFQPIRVPVPDEMIDEVREWAAEKGGEVTRVKGVEFKERFAEVLPGNEAAVASSKLNDVHVNIDGIETEQEFKDVIKESTQFAERGVRMVS